MAKINKIAPTKIKKSDSKQLMDDEYYDKDIVTSYRNKSVAIPFTPIRLRTNTIKNCRKSVGKVTRLAASGKLDLDRAGKLCYLLQTLSSVFKAEAELSVVDEIKKLKADIANLSLKNTDLND